jgi:hypothetical protein
MLRSPFEMGKKLPRITSMHTGYDYPITRALDRLHLMRPMIDSS